MLISKYRQKIEEEIETKQRQAELAEEQRIAEQNLRK
jgi:hypothetical protein